jgi:four helix bundle protein
MPITDPRELRCWQLADALRRKVNAICGLQQLANDFRFCNGFRDAAGSVCRNISEGFARYESPSIVQFFRYSLASLEEVKDYLKESCTRGALDEPELARLLDRCEHTKASAIKFMKPHLKKVDKHSQRPGGKRKRPPPSTP